MAKPTDTADKVNAALVRGKIENLLGETCAGAGALATTKDSWVVLVPNDQAWEWVPA